MRAILSGVAIGLLLTMIIERKKGGVLEWAVIAVGALSFVSLLIG